MAAPTIVDDDTVTSEQAQSAGDHTVSIATNSVAGETLRMFVSVQNGSVSTGPSGWTEYGTKASATSNNHWYWKKSDGSEPSTIVFSPSGSVVSTHICHRITGADDPDTSAPEITMTDHGSASDPDPATHTPSGGSDDYLYITDLAAFSSETLTLQPSGYSTPTERDHASGNNHVFSCDKETTASSSDNPGAWDITFGRYISGTTSVTPSGGDDATVIPATIATVIAIPAPTVIGDETVTPSTIVTTIAIPAPSLSFGTTASPAVLATVIAMPAPAITYGAGLTPATIVTIIAIPAVEHVGVPRPTAQFVLAMDTTSRFGLDMDTASRFIEEMDTISRFGLDMDTTSRFDLEMDTTSRFGLLLE